MVFLSPDPGTYYASSVARREKRRKKRKKKEGLFSLSLGCGVNSIFRKMSREKFKVCSM